MTKILVTGGAGFIASHIADYYLEKGYEVVILDDLSSGKQENIPKNAEFIQGSVTDKEAVNKAMEGAKYVFHLAALVSVPLSLENPDKCMEINEKGTKNILEEALSQNVEKVVFSSSAAVYGDNQNPPLKEEEPYKPLSPYAESKARGEQLCKEYTAKGLKTAILRYFNVYGQRQDPKSQYSGVISIFIDKAKENQDITIYGDGEQTRDFIHIEDVVLANALAAQKGEGTYNVATGKQTSINQLAKNIIQLTNSNSKIIYKEQREGDIQKSLADIQKIELIGLKTTKDLNEGLKTLI